MTPKELDALAHEIAEESEKSVIDCNTSRVTWTDKKGVVSHWWNLRSADARARYYVRRAERYLAARGVLQRNPEQPSLVTWEGDDD